MQRFRLERNVNVDVNFEAPRPLVQGQTVIVAAPVISAPQASERPRAVKQNITQVTVDLGWEGLRRGQLLGVERLAQADVAALPFPAEAFDLAVSDDQQRHEILPTTLVIRESCGSTIKKEG